MGAAHVTSEAANTGHWSDYSWQPGEDEEFGQVPRDRHEHVHLGGVFQNSAVFTLIEREAKLFAGSL